MDITQLKDNLVIELAHDVSKASRIATSKSKKEPEKWPAGTRFAVHGSLDPDRTLPQLVWQLRRIRGNGKYGRDFSETVMQFDEHFIWLVMASNPVRDVRAVLAMLNPSPASILERLADQGAVALEAIEEAARALDQEANDRWDAEQAAKAAAQASTEPTAG